MPLSRTSANSAAVRRDCRWVNREPALAAGPPGRARRKLIVLAGQTPEQIVALTRRADVLVHPRLACRENYSVQSKIAVYLASGRPIVATDFGDYSTILGATGAGHLTEVAPGRLPRAFSTCLAIPHWRLDSRPAPALSPANCSGWTATSTATSTSTTAFWHGRGQPRRFPREASPGSLPSRTDPPPRLAGPDHPCPAGCDAAFRWSLSGRRTGRRGWRGSNAVPAVLSLPARLPRPGARR